MIYEENRSFEGLLTKIWRDDSGQYHNDMGPASISHYKDGAIRCEEYWINHSLHREAGPARIGYYPDGSVEFEIFLSKSIRNRRDGPAAIWYNGDGTIAFENYYIYGKHLGRDKTGFWNLWDVINEEERKHPNILTLLSRYS
jgi:hypothetical protein